jgi:CubicO group peptidase (beta-lactamase class C family)
MTDTGFLVPKEKLPRVATIYGWDKATGALAGRPHDPRISEMPGLPQGGGGLYSTAADYFRFAQMLLNGGELDGARLLKRATVGFSAAQGFGYDFAVVLDPAALKSPLGKGTYWWWGAAGTWFWIDPANDVVFVGIIQRQGGVPGAVNHEAISRDAVYGALTQPTP